MSSSPHKYKSPSLSADELTSHTGLLSLSASATAMTHRQPKECNLPNPKKVKLLLLVGTWKNGFLERTLLSCISL